jgi:imidazolonepropionase-like amidohydrolase
VTRLVLRGGLVFDGTGCAAAAADVTVEGNVIVAVGTDLDGDEELDCTGCFIAPGFIDCHVHAAIANIDLSASMMQPFSLHYFVAAENLRKTLYGGVTAVRDAHGIDLGVKAAVERGLIPGPRTQISIAQVSQTGGHGDRHMACGLDAHPWKMPHPGRPSGVVDGPVEARRKVRELVRMGADVIKICTSGGVMSPLDDPAEPHLFADEIEALVTAAAAADRSVMAHAHGTEGIKRAVRGGVRSIEHGTFLDDEAVELMRDRGTWLVPTLGAVRGVIDAAEAGLPVAASSLAKAREIGQAAEVSFLRAVDAGVRIAMGTDAPLIPHGQNLRELELMTDAGLDSTSALRAATSEAAQLLGIDSLVGTVEPGKRADLVVVRGDPGDCTGLTARVQHVLLDGRRVR